MNDFSKSGGNMADALAPKRMTGLRLDCVFLPDSEQFYPGAIFCTFLRVIPHLGTLSFLNV